MRLLKKSTPFDKKEESIPLDKQKEILYKLVAERDKKYRKVMQKN